MKTYYRKIEDHLECNGWNIKSIDSDHNDWWADEFWELQSTWSPQGAKCCLTFLVDPQFDGVRRSREAVWAVGVTKLKPLCREQVIDDYCISFNKRFNVNIDRFFNTLEHLREI